MDQEEIDKEQLLRYLRGEIPFEQWVQGQQHDDQITVHIGGTPEAAGAIHEEREDDDEEDDDEEEEEDEEEEYAVDVRDEDLDTAGPSGIQVTFQQTAAELVLSNEQNVASSAGDFNQVPAGENAMKIEMQLMRGFRRHQKGELQKQRRSRSRVPKDLRGLLGQAHLCFARKEHEQATKMCMEIIRRAPHSVEPFQLLGMIYEDQGDMEKSMQFQLIAAHVSPRDIEQWQQLADMCIERNDLRKAVYCYTKALKFNHKDISVLHARATLYTKLGEHKRATESYLSIIKALPPEQSHKSIQLAREVVQECHQMGDMTMAIDTLEMVFKNHPNLISSEDVNNLAELYISSQQFQRGIQIMCDYCGVKVLIHDAELSEMHGDDSSDMNIIIPEGLPIDLRVKLAICLIHLRHLSAVAEVTKPLFVEDPEMMGDLYLDVAEAFIEINNYKEARPILAALVAAKNYNLPAVWLRYAECLNSLGELAEASKAYKAVLKQAPRHLDARLALAAIEQQLGRTESALQALSLDPVDDDADQFLSKQDIQLLFRQCSLLHAQRNSEEFTDKALNLLAKFLQKDQEDYANYCVISKAEWFGLVQKACQALGMVKKYGDSCQVLQKVIESNLFEKETDKLRKLKFMLVCSSYLNESHDTAFTYIREFVNQYGDKPNLMNLFSLIVSNTYSTRHHRFCLRLTIKLYSDSPILSVINGHNAMKTSSYKHALGEYVRAHFQNPTEPFLLLCIGVCLFALASQRFTINKDSVIAQGFTCLRLHQRLRGHTQETYYNIGRAFHQVGMTHLAVHYYQKALHLPPVIPNDERFDLRPQIAFNFSLIYRQNGNLEMAQELLSTYCVI